MRPRDATFHLNPPMSPGIGALRRQLGAGGADAPADILGPITALTELQAICRAMLAGRGGPNLSNRPSIVNDVSVALAELGAETQEVLGSVLRDFQRETGALSGKSGRLATPQGARVVSLAIEPLLARLSRDAALQAMWRDAVTSFLDVEVAAETCEIRLLQLAETVKAAGIDWKQRADTLEVILSNDPRYLNRVAAVEHEAGKLSEDERLGLCESQLVEPMALADVVVWLVINDAALADGYKRIGPIQLFDGGAWPDGVRPGGWLEQRVDELDAPELADWNGASIWFAHLPEATHRVFARVTIDEVAPQAGRERAQRVLRSMIDLAHTHSAWTLLEGAASWRREGGWSGSSFLHPRELEESRRPLHVVFERTAEGLDDFDPTFVARMTAADPVAEEAVDDALWTVAVERAPTAAQRLVLATRALERTLSHVRESPNDSWAEPAARYLRWPWIDYTLQNELLDAGVCAAYPPSLPSARGSEQFRRIRWSVFPPDEDGTFNLRGFADVVDEAAAAVRPGSYEQRILRSASELLSRPEAAVAVLKRIEVQFDRLLRRTERSRNALVHGTGIVEEVLSGVDDFVQILARLVAQEAMRQAETGTPPLSALEERRTQWLDRRARLAAGQAPLDVLLGD
jgi:hypothetical protein